MKDLKTEFLDYMDLNGVRYRELNDHAVLISYHGEKLNTISIHVIFPKTASKPASPFATG